MRFLGYEISSPTVLAPMAGVTDYAYRCICAEMGVGVTVTEMVSSRALFRVYPWCGAYIADLLYTSGELKITAIHILRELGDHLFSIKVCLRLYKFV